MNEIKNVAIIGAGVIGAGWAARLVENNIKVRIFDLSESAIEEAKLTFIQAKKVHDKLFGICRKRASITFSKTLECALENVDLVIESIPEQLELKTSLYKQIEQNISTHVPICSSTSGFIPSQLQANMLNPARLFVAHPTNPVYILPMVELVYGQKHDQQLISHLQDFYRTIGMIAFVISKEIDAFVADRLLESLWREALWLVKDGICTTETLDDIIRYGFGLRMAQMGIFENYRLAGGKAGMRHFLRQFGPCLKWPWSRLTDVPDFDEQLIDLIASQSDSQSDKFSIEELIKLRDDNLISIVQGLQAKNWAAGKLVNEYQLNAHSQYQASKAVHTHTSKVDNSWCDYNQHMNEAYYGHCFSEATDKFLQLIGCDSQYVASGFSFFTKKNTIEFMHEANANETIYIDTILYNLNNRTIELLHRMYSSAQAETKSIQSERILIATCHSIQVNVSLTNRKSVQISDELASKIAKYS